MNDSDTYQCYRHDHYGTLARMAPGGQPQVFNPATGIWRDLPLESAEQLWKAQDWTGISAEQAEAEMERQRQLAAQAPG